MTVPSFKVEETQQPVSSGEQRTQFLLKSHALVLSIKEEAKPGLLREM